MSTEKDLNYWKANAEEDYKQVPMSVLRYITELEQEVKNYYIPVVSNRFKTRVVTKSGTWFLTDEEIKQWEYDGSIEKGDKAYATILIKEY